MHPASVFLWNQADRERKKNYSYLNIQIDLNEESETKEKKIILLVHKIGQATGNIKGSKK